MEQKTILFNLIKAAFNKQTFKFETDNELALMSALTENGLVGLVYKSINLEDLKDVVYQVTLKNIFNNFIKKDIQQGYYIDLIGDAFNKAEIKHVFLKGVVLKGLYPESYMRGMGDIDVLVPKPQFEAANKVLKSLDFKYVGATSHHHGYSSNDGIEVELHQSITSIVEYDNKNLLSDVWAHVKLKDLYRYEMIHEFEYVYLLTHLVRHMRTSGVGIRSILDIEVYLSHYEDQMDKAVLNDFLNRTNLHIFEQKVRHLNQIFLLKKDMADEEELIIDYIMTSGIHGKGKNHDRYITKRTYEQTRKKKSKLGYMLSEAFPSRERLQESYPYLKKHGWLLPWAWMVRLFKQLFKIKDTKKRISAVVDDKNLEETTRVYDYFGI